MSELRNILWSLIVTVILSLFSLSMSAQVDTAFWFAVPKLCDHAHTPITLVVTTFDEPATITITKPASSTPAVATFNVAANSSGTQVLVQNDAGLTNFQCPHNAISNFGLYIHSTSKVNAYVAVQQNNSEIYALKGRNGLGKQFFVTTQFQFDNGNGAGTSAYAQARNTAEIIATENNTTVTITPSVTCGTHAANIPFTVVLNKGQVYCLASNFQTGINHLCGTTITSDKPIVVDVSDDSVTPHCSETTDPGNASADLVADQLVPEDLAGGQYIVVPSPTNVNNNAPASGGGNHYLDYVCIFGLEDNTTVRIYNSTSPYVPTTYTLNRGSKMKYHFPNTNPIFIYATNQDMTEERKIFVFQVTGAGKEFGGTQLPHIYCTGSTAVGYRPLQSANNHTKSLYLTLLCNANYTSGFQINGNSNVIAASDWQDVPGAPAFKYCRKNVSSNFSPTYSNMIPFRVTNSLGKFHMGVFDINGSYDDCSISYFSSYVSESSIAWNEQITHHDYCEGETIIFGFDTVDASIMRIVGPNDFEIENPPYQMSNVSPDASGWYTVVATDARGCLMTPIYDSIEITVSPSVESMVYDTICPGTDYSGHGFTISADSTAEVGTLYDTITLQTSALGCDSLLILELTIRDIVVQGDVYDEVCFGEAYTGFGGLFQFPADSAMEVRTLTDTVRLAPHEGSEACDSLLVLHLTVRDSVRSEFSKFACNQYTWNGHTYAETGDYLQTLTDAHGCDSIVTLHLEIEVPAVEIVTSGDDFCEFGELVLTAESDYEEYIWNTGETTPFITATKPGLYTVTVTQGECQAYDNYTIPSCEFHIYMPNSITPSRADGINDYFFLPEYVHRFLTEFEIEIYDRWGELIYWNNDMNFKWYGEKAHVSDVYVWVIRVRNLDGKQFVFRGSVTVL